MERVKKYILVFLVALLPAIPLRAQTSTFAVGVRGGGMMWLPGDDPLDGPDQDPTIPPRPAGFHATINGHFLRITKQDTNIPSAQVSVVNASNGGLVLNQLMTDSMEETISSNGVYVLHIETDGGAFIGQFIVQ